MSTFTTTTITTTAETDTDNKLQNKYEENITKSSRQPLPEKSIEGWIIIIRNVHEEIDESDMTDKCLEFGDVKNLVMELDKRTALGKGYALVEFSQKSAAEGAIAALNGSELRGRTLAVDWAFVNGPLDNNYTRFVQQDQQQQQQQLLPRYHGRIQHNRWHERGRYRHSGRYNGRGRENDRFKRKRSP